MAGVKVTDLTTLATADPTDIMYIVDTTANQSKQIEVQDIYSGMPQLDSGTWNPTPTNISGTNAVVTIIKGNYSRVGDVVTCSLLFQLNMDAAENISFFTLTLPIASNFAFAKDAFGIISYSNLGDGELVGFNITADSTNDLIGIDVTSLTNGASYQFLTALIQYVVI
jgi:hypothetical protein